MKKLVSVILTLCMVLCMLPVPVAADELPVVTLDVGTTETYDDTNYKVDKDTIILRAEGQVYELTGTTDRQIRVLGTNAPAEPKTYHIRLNNATINGGMTINNSTGAKLVIDVAAGTVNTVKRIYSADLTITGSGTLNMEDMGVTQSTRTNNPSSLYIEDTTINVNLPSTRSGQWEGTCELAGSAKVTYTSCGNYPALKLGQGSGMTHSLTMKGSASLYCVQADASDPSNYRVNGLENYSGATITLQDNAYLEAQGRDCTNDDWLGSGVMAGGDIFVLGNATLKATAYGSAIATWGNVTVNGGKLIAVSTKSNGVYAAGTIDISNNATAEVKGYYPALYGDAGVTIANSTVKAVADDVAIYSPSTVTLNNSIVDAAAPDDCDGIYANNGVQVTGCWINTTGPETFDSDPDGIVDSVLFNKKVGEVIGNASIPGDVTVEKDMKLAIPEGTALTVPTGTTLTNHGLITLKGTLNRDGTIICDSHNGGTATCQEQAKCDICLAAYGDVDAANHTGSLVWEYTETSHTQKYDCCGAIAVAEEAHDWADGKCTKCGYVCKHVAGTPATCVDKAVCQYCGESFGDVDAANHSDLRHVTKVDATETTDGNIEYWYCAGCGKYYSDDAATKEITKDATVIPAQPAKPTDTTVKPVGGKDTWSKGCGTLDFEVEPGAQEIAVKVDGKDVDAKNYTLTTDPKTGKTTVSLHADYLATLGLGTHKLTVTTADGTATTTFKVDRVYADAPSGKTDSKTDTKTGDGVKSAGTADNFPMASMAAALVLSAGALAVLTVRGRRKEQDAQ